MRYRSHVLFVAFIVTLLACGGGPGSRARTPGGPGGPGPGAGSSADGPMALTWELAAADVADKVRHSYDAERVEALMEEIGDVSMSAASGEVHVSQPLDLDGDGADERLVRLCMADGDDDEEPRSGTCADSDEPHYLELTIWRGHDFVASVNYEDRNSGVTNLSFEGVERVAARLHLVFEYPIDELPDLTSEDCGYRLWQTLGPRGEIEDARRMDWCELDGSVEDERPVAMTAISDGGRISVIGANELPFEDGDVVADVSFADELAESLPDEADDPAAVMNSPALFVSLVHLATMGRGWLEVTVERDDKRVELTIGGSQARPADEATGSGSGGTSTR